MEYRGNRDLYTQGDANKQRDIANNSEANSDVLVYLSGAM